MHLPLRPPVSNSVRAGAVARLAMSPFRPMRRFRPLCLFAVSLIAAPVFAQTVGQTVTLRAAGGPARTSVVLLDAEGPTLWATGLLSRTRDGGASWQQVDLDSLRFGQWRAYAMETRGPNAIAGLAYATANDFGERIDTGSGFLFSTNGGDTFRFTAPITDRVGDSTLVYGVSRLRAFSFLTPDGAAPFSISLDADSGVVYAAAGEAGLRRSINSGASWQRVVLPPDTQDELRPDALNAFYVGPRTRTPRGHFNHVVYSVLVDEAGTVWAGSRLGLNRSDDRGVSWRRLTARAGAGSLPASAVQVIREQPLAGARNPVWIALVPAGVQAEVAGATFGVAVTRDGGLTYEQTLLGEQVFDFAFRGSTVYAAAARGLFASDDGGRSWRLLRDFFDADRPGSTVPLGARVFSVATTADGALWVGTEAGLARSLDGGATWRVFRADVPLAPERPDASQPVVDTYAYPNPFSPALDGLVRIRFDGGDATVRIFDFAMRLVRTLDADGSGEREVQWDGFDARGVRAPNGPYFYAVEQGGRSVRGKILVIE